MSSPIKCPFCQELFGVDRIDPWVSVKDRYPKVGEDVIVYDGEIMEQYYLYDCRNGKPKWSCLDEDIEVTHWIPFPNAPTENPSQPS